MTRSRRGRRGGHGGGGGGGGGHGGGDARWLVTYADLLTLLMVLFLVLWVISTIDLKKFEQFKSGLGDFGNKAASAAKPVAPTPDPNGLTNAPTVNPDTTTTAAPIDTSTGNSSNSTDGTTVTAPKPLDAQQLSGMVAGLNSTINSKGLGDVVNVHVEQRGLVVSISTDNVLFDSGQGVLTAAGAQIIHTVGPELSALANDMIIEGYTDKRPLRRQGYDNWDLSVDRAVSVLKVLRDDFGVPPARLAATGYGDQHPVAAGDDNASMARNRRIEIVVVAGPAS
jgi:chemotaxis protein MotB